MVSRSTRKIFLRANKAAGRGADVANGAVELLGPIGSRPVSARQIRESELTGEIRAGRMRSIELRTVCKKFPQNSSLFLTLARSQEGED